MVRAALAYRWTGHPQVLVLAFGLVAELTVLWAWVVPGEVLTLSPRTATIITVVAVTLLLGRSRLAWLALICLTVVYGLATLGAALILLDRVALSQSIMCLVAFSILWSPALEQWLYAEESPHRSQIA
jgi:hypothetical protein